MHKDGTGRTFASFSQPREYSQFSCAITRIFLNKVGFYNLDLRNSGVPRRAGSPSNQVFERRAPECM